VTDDTKTAIARAATAEFAEFGFHGARTARIARAAGVNKQLLFYYFGTKTGLYTEVVGAAAETLGQYGPVREGAGQPRQPAAERIRSWMGQISTACQEHPQLIRLVLGSSGGPTEAASVAQGFLRELARTLAAEISAGQGLGFFRDDADPVLVATQALTLVFGFVLLDFPSRGDGRHEGRHHWDAEAADWVIRTLSW
jgi:TetR/AcrR family transcriptional regulator